VLFLKSIDEFFNDSWDVELVFFGGYLVDGLWLEWVFFRKMKGA